MEAENPLLWQRISVASNAKLFQSSTPRKEMSLERFIHVQRMYHVSTGRLTQQDDRVDLVVDEIPIVLPDAEWDDEDAADPDGEEGELFPLPLVTSPPHNEIHQEEDQDDGTQAEDHSNDDDEDDDDEDDEDDQAKPITAEGQSSAGAAADTYRVWDMPSYEGAEEGIISVFNLGLLSHIPLPPNVLEDFQDALVSDDFEPGILPPSTSTQVTPLLYEATPSLTTLPLSAATSSPTQAALVPGSPSSADRSTSEPPTITAVVELPSAAAPQPEDDEPPTFPRKRSHLDGNDNVEIEVPKRRRTSVDANVTSPPSPSRKRLNREDDDANDERVILKRRRASLDATIASSVTEGSLAQLQRTLSTSPRLPPINCGQEDEEHDGRETEHQPTSIPGDATPPPIILGV